MKRKLKYVIRLKPGKQAVPENSIRREKQKMGKRLRIIGQFPLGIC